jgi:hypothetical protein
VETFITSCYTLAKLKIKIMGFYYTTLSLSSHSFKNCTVKLEGAVEKK